MSKNYDGIIGRRIIGAILAIGLISLVFLFIFLLGQSTTKDTEVVIMDSSFEIKGMFGEKYDLNKISSMELKDTIPAIGRKVNGSGLGETCKGDFEVDGLGECKLYKLSNSGPFLYIKANGKYVIINYKERVKTENLYNELIAKWKK